MMAGSVTDKDILLDSDLERGSASLQSPAKRQQMMGSPSSPTLAPSDINNSNNSGTDADHTVAVKSQTEMVETPMMESGQHNVDRPSESDDGDSVQPLPATAAPAPAPAAATAIVIATAETAKQTLELGEQAVAAEDSVDPAPVPRRLRSATNKRRGQSASPPVSRLKNQRQCKSYGDQACDKITEDEKEVIQALCELSRVNPTCSQVDVEKEGTNSEDNLNDKMNSSSSSPEVLKDAIIPLPCDGIPNEATVTDKIVPNSSSQSSEPNAPVDLSTDIVNAPASLEAPPNYFRSSHNDDAVKVHHVSESDTDTVPGPPGTAAIDDAPEKEELGKKPVGQKDQAAPPGMGTLPSIVADDSPKLLPTRSPAVWPGAPANSNANANANATGHLPVETTPPPPAAAAAIVSGRNCATHIRISHFIRSCQERENQESRYHPSFPSNNNNFNSNLEEMPLLERLGGGGGGGGGVSEMPRIGHDLGRIGERNASHELTNAFLHNGRCICCPQRGPYLSEAPAGRTQPQARQFFPLTSGSDARNSGTSTRRRSSSGQLRLPFIQSQLSWQSAQVPYPFSHNNVPYTEPLPTPATRLSGPPYLGRSPAPSYGPQSPAYSSDVPRLQQQRQHHHHHHHHHHIYHHHPPGWNAYLVPRHGEPPLGLLLLNDCLRHRLLSPGLGGRRHSSPALAPTLPAEVPNYATYYSSSAALVPTPPPAEVGDDGTHSSSALAVAVPHNPNGASSHPPNQLPAGAPPSGINHQQHDGHSTAASHQEEEGGPSQLQVFMR